jgi:uncharacterized protein YdhG (YjbR/CyaY superfamily)
MATKTAKPETVDQYLAGVPGEQRAALERLRETIRAVAPEATETISYGMPAFKLHGSLVGFAAFKNHCSFFPMSATLIEAHKEELSGYRTSKGTIQFTADKPLPAPLVRKLVKQRIEENETRHRP